MHACDQLQHCPFFALVEPLPCTGEFMKGAYCLGNFEACFQRMALKRPACAAPPAPREPGTGPQGEPARLGDGDLEALGLSPAAG